MRDVTILSVAHHPGPGLERDPGAVSPDGRLTEADWSERLCTLIAAECSRRGVPTEIVDEPLGRTIRLLRQRTGVALVVEPHLNGARNPKADAGLVIVHGPEPAPAALRFAEALVPPLTTVRSAGGFTAPTVIWRTPIDGERGPRRLGIVDRQPHPGVITEAGFITNPAFAAWVARPEAMAELARVHAEAIVAAVNPSRG